LYGGENMSADVNTMSYTPCFNEEDGLGINEKDGF
jgi:hypothetical protein